MLGDDIFEREYTHQEPLSDSDPCVCGVFMQVGDVVCGTVAYLQPYGAMIDMGDSRGLLHISQISHLPVSCVKDILSKGDKLKVENIF